MTSLTDFAEELRWRCEAYNTQLEFTEDDYIHCIKVAIKQLYIRTGRALGANQKVRIFREGGNTYINDCYALDEEEFILLWAEKRVLEFLMSEHSDDKDYKTNAISVSGTNKTYGNLAGRQRDIENECDVLLSHMPRYVGPQAG